MSENWVLTNSDFIGMTAIEWILPGMTVTECEVYTYSKSRCPEVFGGHLGHNFLKSAIGHRATA